MHGDEEIVIEKSPTDISVESCVGPHVALVFLQPVAVSYLYDEIKFNSIICLRKIRWSCAVTGVNAKSLV